MSNPNKNKDQIFIEIKLQISDDRIDKIIIKEDDDIEIVIANYVKKNKFDETICNYILSIIDKKMDENLANLDSNRKNSGDGSESMDLFFKNKIESQREEITDENNKLDCYSKDKLTNSFISDSNSMHNDEFLIKNHNKVVKINKGKIKSKIRKIENNSNKNTSENKMDDFAKYLIEDKNERKNKSKSKIKNAIISNNKFVENRELYNYSNRDIRNENTSKSKSKIKNEVNGICKITSDKKAEVSTDKNISRIKNNYESHSKIDHELHNNKSHSKSKSRSNAKIKLTKESENQIKTPRIGEEVNYGEKLYTNFMRKLKKKKIMIENAMKQKIEEEMKEATFKPNINDTSRHLNSKLSNKYLDLSTENRLIQQGKETNDKKRSLIDSKILKEIHDMPFKPSINEKSVELSKKIKEERKKKIEEMLSLSKHEVKDSQKSDDRMTLVNNSQQVIVQNKTNNNFNNYNTIDNSTFNKNKNQEKDYFNHLDSSEELSVEINKSKVKQIVYLKNKIPVKVITEKLNDNNITNQSFTNTNKSRSNNTLSHLSTVKNDVNLTHSEVYDEKSKNINKWKLDQYGKKVNEIKSNKEFKVIEPTEYFRFQDTLREPKLTAYNKPFFKINSNKNKRNNSNKNKEHASNNTSYDTFQTISNIHDELYMNGKLINIKLKKETEKYKNENYPFKPFISKSPDISAYKTKEKKEDLIKRLVNSKRLCSENCNKLDYVKEEFPFKPNTNVSRSKSRENIQRKEISPNLDGFYDQRLFKDKEILENKHREDSEMNRNFWINESMKKILKLKINYLKEIFDKLDSDADGLISIKKIKLVDVEERILDKLSPILENLKNNGKEMSFKEFFMFSEEKSIFN